MQIIIKHFNELSVNDLFEIYKLRQEIFIVEQNCPYNDIDEADKVSFHIMVKENNSLVAYSRAIPQNVTYNEASIGRVISKIRRKGYASLAVENAINVACNVFHAKKIKIGAQVYAKTLYEKFGFKQVSDIYLEDNIPHIHMMLDLN